MPSPARGLSPAGKKAGGKKSKKSADGPSQPKEGVSHGTDASLNEWSALVSKKGSSGNDGQQGGHQQPGSKGGNFVSLLDANALKSMKGKGKGKGKGGLLGAAGGNEEANEKACAICAVTEASVYPPYPRCEISMNALAAIAHYHLTKPKKKEVKPKRGGSSRSKSAQAKKDDSSPASGKRKTSPPPPPSSPKTKQDATSSSKPVFEDEISSKENNNKNLNTDENNSNNNNKTKDAPTVDLSLEHSIPAVPPPDQKSEKEKKQAEEAAARSSTAHVMYCLTCRCLYDDEQRHSWMPHRYCERCLYCTHGYRDVRILDLSPGAATTCKDGLHVPQTYLEVRAQADQGIHWVMPLHESDVLQGRPNLLPPEARDFKSAMNRATKKEDPLEKGETGGETGGENTLNASNQQVEEVKEFVYEEALTNAVCDIVVSAEETRRKSLVKVSERNWYEDMLNTTDDFGERFMTIATRYYSSQIFLLHEKCRQETRKLRAAWFEEIKAKKTSINEKVDEFFIELDKERNESFQEIWTQIGQSRGAMMRRFASKEIFELHHQEALARSALLREQDDRRYIFWLTTMNLPNFVHDSIQFQKDSIRNCQEKQKDIWKELNAARVEVGSEKLFDEFGFKQIVTYSTVSRLRLQVEAEGDKIYERDVKEKAGRVDLRYYFLRGKLQAIESEKRRSYATQRLNFLHMMLNVQENEERQVTGQSCMREFSQVLTSLRKQAKSEGLFPSLKQQAMNDAGLSLSPSKSASLFDKKGKLIIPNIPYKKPPNPVPASATFIQDVTKSLARVFTDPDDVFITDDGRVGLIATKENEAGAELAKERASASFFPAESRRRSSTPGSPTSPKNNNNNSKFGDAAKNDNNNKSSASKDTGGAGLSVGKQSSHARQVPYGTTYFDPSDPPPPEMEASKIREAAANQIKKQRGRRRGGGKTANYNANEVAKDLPIMMNVLEFMGEVGTSIGQMSYRNLAASFFAQMNNNGSFSPSIMSKKGGGGGKGGSNINSKSPASAKRRSAATGKRVNSPSPDRNNNNGDNLEGSLRKDSSNDNNNNNNSPLQQNIEEGDNKVANEDRDQLEETMANVENDDESAMVKNNNNDSKNDDDVDDKERKSKKQTSSPGSPGSLSPQQSILAAGNNSNSSFRLTSGRSENNINNPSMQLDNFSMTNLNATMSMSFNPMSQTVSGGGGGGGLLPHQRLDFVDRSILSSNAYGRPTSTLFDDESNHLWFFNAVRREDNAYRKALNDTEDLMKQAMDRICVPPPPRHKRERKPQWVEQRSNEIFKAANIPALPPPPPPPPKPKPKPKGAANTRGGGRANSAGGGDPDDQRKKKVKFTDAEGESLEFPEGEEPSAGNKSNKPKPKRSDGPKADPALMAAMTASQSQREMMRAMSMQAAGSENGEDAEGAAFAMGHHDDGGGDGAGSGFSLLLAQALDGGKGSAGKKKKGGKKSGRHYEFM